MERLINAVSARLERKAVLAPGDREVFAYGLDLLLFTTLTKAGVLLLGLLAGRFWETLLYTVAFSALQSLGGGYHAPTHFTCFLTTAAGWGIAMLLVSFAPALALLAVLAVGFGLVFRLAPVENANAPMRPEKKRRMRQYTRVACVACACVGVVCWFLWPAGFAAISAAVGLSGISKLIGARMAAREGGKAEA